MNKKKIFKISVATIVLIVILVITYQIATWKREYYINEKNIQIPIFLYHNIVEDKSQIEYDYMQTDKETFEKQIKGLKKYGYTVITYDDLKKYKNGQKAIPKHSCLIDFDDGYEGNLTVALEVIEKYKIPVNIYVIDNCIGTPGYMTWEQIKQMDNTGLVTINSHGKEHYDFSRS